MNSSIKLLDGEKIIFECSPQQSLVGYLLIQKSLKMIIKTIIWILLIVGYLYYSLTKNNHTDNVHFSMSNLHIGQISLLIVAIILLLTVCSYYWLSIIVSRYKYIFTDQRCLIYSGFIGINKKVIPYNRIADVDILQGTLEALFGISNVLIDEQAMNVANRLFLYGLSMDDAEQVTHVVSDHITKKQA